MTDATPDTTPDTTPAPERTYRNLALTGRPPVRICEQDWPLVAEARRDQDDSALGNEPNRQTRAGIRVRQHRDGRGIVTAWFDYSSAFANEPRRSYSRGELLAAATTIRGLPAAIQRVAASMPEDASCPWTELAQECITGLPPEILDGEACPVPHQRERYSPIRPSDAPGGD